MGAYQQLIKWYEKGDVDFSQVSTFNLDEYVGLSDDDPQSYHYFMRKNFFDHVNIDLAKTHVPDGATKDPESFCKNYDRMIAEAGYPDCTICASNSLDEYIVRDLILQGARVDSFGIGENMITAKSDPVFGGVYKLAAVKEDDGSYTPKMKLSESVEKMTIPCLKKVWRIYDEDGKAQADLITMADEVVDTKNGITLFDPIETWKECTYVNCTARCLSTPIYENGKRVYSSQSLDDIKKFCKAQVNTLWDEVKRFENPHRYYVDLSQKLWDTRSALLKKLSK